MTIATYKKAHTIAEAFSLLQQQVACDSKQKSVFVCGTTDFMISRHAGDSQERVDCIDVSEIQELKGCRELEGVVTVGAAYRLADMVKNPTIIDSALILHQAAEQIGSPQIRNRASIGGNVITAAQCADTIPVLLVLDAQLHLTNLQGEKRIVPIEEFFTGPKKTDLRKHELLTAISYPSLKAAGYTGGFYKLIRREAVAKSRLNFAVLVKVDPDGIMQDVRISIGAALSVPGRFSPVEQFMIGRKANTALCKEAAEQCADYVLASTGVRWSTPYKQPVIADVMYRMLCRCTGVQETQHA